MAGMGRGSTAMEVTHYDASYECSCTGQRLLSYDRAVHAPLLPRPTVWQLSTHEVPNPGLRHWLLGLT